MKEMELKVRRIDLTFELFHIHLNERLVQVHFLLLPMIRLTSFFVWSIGYIRLPFHGRKTVVIYSTFFSFLQNGVIYFSI